MANFIHAHQNLSKGDVVVVQCSHQCNIFLLDDANFNSYRLRQKCTYFGGFYRAFPAKLAVPANGHWNVVIDLAGREVQISHSISYLKQPTRPAG
jgi:hypothetical protein